MGENLFLNENCWQLRYFKCPHPTYLLKCWQTLRLHIPWRAISFLATIRLMTSASTARYFAFSYRDSGAINSCPAPYRVCQLPIRSKTSCFSFPLFSYQASNILVLCYWTCHFTNVHRPLFSHLHFVTIELAIPFLSQLLILLFILDSDTFMGTYVFGVFA